MLKHINVNIPVLSATVGGSTKFSYKQLHLTAIRSSIVRHGSKLGVRWFLAQTTHILPPPHPTDWPVDTIDVILN